LPAWARNQSFSQSTFAEREIAIRVVEQTPDRPLIEIRPGGLMILCVGLFLMSLAIGFGMRLFIPTIAGLAGFDILPGLSSLPLMPGTTALGYASAVPLLVAVLLIKTRRLTLDRPAGQVTLATRGVFGRGGKIWPMADLQGANPVVSRSHNSGTTCRAVLRFAGSGDVPVTPCSTRGPGPSRTVDAIDGWLCWKPPAPSRDVARGLASQRGLTAVFDRSIKPQVF